MRPNPFGTTISVILPAYNEELSIAKAAGDALEFLSAAFVRFEVIVVDDGSSDDTANIIRGLAVENANLRLIQHPKNLGYGRAIANGFAAAKHELIFFTDADSQFDIRELADFIPLIQDRDAVFGFRIYRYDSVTRCLLSWVYNLLACPCGGRRRVLSMVFDREWIVRVLRHLGLPWQRPVCAPPRGYRGSLSFLDVAQTERLRDVN